MLTAAALGTAAAGAPSLMTRAAAADTAPRDAGYTRLAFVEDFNSPDVIDWSGRGLPGKSFYLDLPWTNRMTPTDRIRVENSSLIVDQAWTNQNVAVTSLSARSGEGRSFGYGLYEARMRFDPSLGIRSNGYPSFWMLPKGQLHNTQFKRHGEIDVFEAYHAPGEPYTGYFAGTVHDSQPQHGWNYRHVQNRNNVTFRNITTPQWHTYGALWEPGKVTWYFDGAVTTSVSYGADRLPSAATWDPIGGQDVSESGTFSVLDQRANEGMGIIFGTAPGWPLEIDWVKVWTR
ncbi:family 16 glycosylhydrolase [Luteococcus sp.]|uniref:glycoside hydrolase family 16 protein n=1 Tax=Luteococcus sp. TaxID=1969402 RepID=UPI002647A998|nr:family 16 glycosylhydrolase [Luteococcus sp.]